MIREKAKPLSNKGFACLVLYVRQPVDASDPELLLVDLPSWIHKAHISERLEGGRSVVSLVLRDKLGEVVEQAVRLQESAFAELLIRTCLGETAFIDWADGKPYLKVFGSRPSAAGIVFARILGRAADGDVVTYLNGDTLDLRAANLMLKRGPSRRNAVDVLAETLYRASEIPDRLGINRDEFKALVFAAEDRFDGLHGLEIAWE
ncbi:MAG TPA: hypothetical protein VFB45_06885 [Pseudolabrys sp.]|nr:hypothetical protein [Pseudolabrys sp.]